ncbi:uncharacterized protein TNCV_4904311 [Trichonephila clavipes]|nr:uncharacterized protein TNCV_4904311 [Trichonephila clavipes]
MVTKSPQVAKNEANNIVSPQCCQVCIETSLYVKEISPSRIVVSDADCCAEGIGTLARKDVQFRRFRRQYEQLSQFKRERTTGMVEAGWSAKRIPHQVGRSDCVVGRGVVTSRSERYHSHDDRIRTPSTDQSSRRPPHHKKCTR